MRIAVELGEQDGLGLLEATQRAAGAVGLNGAGQQTALGQFGQCRALGSQHLDGGAQPLQQRGGGGLDDGGAVGARGVGAGHRLLVHVLVAVGFAAHGNGGRGCLLGALARIPQARPHGVAPARGVLAVGVLGAAALLDQGGALDVVLGLVVPAGSEHHQRSRHGYTAFRSA